MQKPVHLEPRVIHFQRIGHAITPSLERAFGIVIVAHAPIWREQVQPDRKAPCAGEQPPPAIAAERRQRFRPADLAIVARILGLARRVPHARIGIEL
ncbi:MAG TPA: hypothetical protein PLM58_13670 [Novosphingobium sp.]|nr:MAG: hypothetical protein B7Z34_02610 [Novosphingobium sp. 12-62-10]HQS70677.1 hypothetical protein [Novosphingobium sp.]